MISGIIHIRSITIELGGHNLILPELRRSLVDKFLGVATGIVIDEGLAEDISAVI
jgi:hypothetical protein